MPDYKKTKVPEVPLSEATIPTKLADIRQKCSELLTADGEIALHLDDGQQPALGNGAYNPYDRNA